LSKTDRKFNDSRERTLSSKFSIDNQDVNIEFSAHDAFLG